MEMGPKPGIDSYRIGHSADWLCAVSGASPVGVGPGLAQPGAQDFGISVP